MQIAYNYMGKELHAMLGEAIHKARISKKMSLRDVAKKTGLSYQFIWDIETGRRVPSLRNLQKIITVLEIKVFLSSDSANSILSSMDIPVNQN